MSSYRFCRSDDIGLLVDALNRCWSPYFPGERPVTTESFKRSIRDLQVWCSSCMVAFSGADPIGVLIGAKRATATLIHRIAVHPDHLRQGHGRHLLTSLSSKLAILGPPRIVAEVPEEFGAGRALFKACGYVEEAVLTDYVRSEFRANEGLNFSSDDAAARFVIPVTVDDLAANGLLENPPPTCWQRSVETLMARKDEMTGLAVATDEGIEAYILYLEDEVLALSSLVEDRGARLSQLLSHVQFAVRLPKVHLGEVLDELLVTLGFRRTGNHSQFAGRPTSN